MTEPAEIAETGTRILDALRTVVVGMDDPLEIALATHGTVELPAKDFGRQANISLIHQVVTAQLAAARTVVCDPRRVSTPPSVPPLAVRRLRLDAVLPVRQHPGDAGLDLCAVEPVRIGPGERAKVPTGLAVAIPVGFAGVVTPRSGLAAG